MQVKQLVKEALSLDTDIRKKLDQKMKEIYFERYLKRQFNFRPAKYALSCTHHTFTVDTKNWEQIVFGCHSWPRLIKNVCRQTHSCQQ